MAVNTDCPITDIKMLDNPAEDDPELVIPDGYKALAFNSDKTLVYQQSNIVSSVFGFFHISVGSNSCYNKYLQDDENDHYLLLTDKHNGCGAYGKDKNAF